MKHRTDTLKIGKYISNALEDIITIYPIVAEKTAKFPFAVYRRTNLSNKNTKDVYNYEEAITMEIICCAVTYNESVELAQKIKDKLENTRGKFESSEINQISMTNANEDWSNDAYIQRLYFNVDIDNGR